MNQEEFSPNIWAELVKLVDREGIENVSIKRIQSLFLLSNSRARQYHYMLNNFHKITDEGKLLRELDKYKSKNARLHSQLRLINKELERHGSIRAVEEAFEKHSVEAHEIPQASASRFDQPVAKVALLSDIHIEEEFPSSVTNGINTYNAEIATKRLMKYFARLIYLIKADIRKGHNVTDLVIGYLGDGITGYIHEELMESNNMTPIEASLYLENLLISGFKEICNEFRKKFNTITIVMMRGNHSRTSKRKKYVTGYKNSYEWYIAKHIQEHFDNLSYDNVNVLTSTSEFLELNIYDKIWVFSHGDHFNYRGGIGGVMVPFRRFAKEMQSIIPADRYVIGHWHSSWYLPFGVINGSVIGYSPYAMGHHLEPEPPQQWLLTQDSKLGFTGSELIKLTD